MRRIVPALIVGLLAVVGALAVPWSASAAPPARPLPPGGSGWVWGAPMETLSVNCGLTEFQTAGGWDRAGIVAEGYDSALTPPRSIRPSFGQLFDPCYDPALSAALRFQVGSISEAVPNSGADATVGCTTAPASCYYPARTRIGSIPDYPIASTVTCATSQWSLPSTHVVRPWNNSRLVSVNAANGGPNVVYGNPATGATAITQANCPFVVALTVNVANYSEELGSGTPTRTVQHWRWSAESYYRQAAYAPFDPLVEVCKAAPDSNADCEWIVTGSQPDGTDFNLVCAGAPEFTWGDWDWLPYFVGHYADCLFNPLNGWDRTGYAASQYDWKIAPAQDAVSVLFNAWFGLYEGCGVVFSYQLFGNPLVIDTCTITWASQFKTFWGVVTLMFSFIGIAVAVLGTLTNAFRSNADVIAKADE